MICVMLHIVKQQLRICSGQIKCQLSVCRFNDIECWCNCTSVVQPLCPVSGNTMIGSGWLIRRPLGFNVQPPYMWYYKSKINLSCLLRKFIRSSQQFPQLPFSKSYRVYSTSLHECWSVLCSCALLLFWLCWKRFYVTSCIRINDKP